MMLDPLTIIALTHQRCEGQSRARATNAPLRRVQSRVCCHTYPYECGLTKANYNLLAPHSRCGDKTLGSRLGILFSWKRIFKTSLLVCEGVKRQPSDIFVDRTNRKAGLRWPQAVAMLVFFPRQYIVRSCTTFAPHDTFRI